jgi:hypothetical protein
VICCSAIQKLLRAVVFLILCPMHWTPQYQTQVLYKQDVLLLFSLLTVLRWRKIKIFFISIRDTELWHHHVRVCNEVFASNHVSHYGINLHFRYKSSLKLKLIPYWHRWHPTRLHCIQSTVFWNSTTLLETYNTFLIVCVWGIN